MVNQPYLPRLIDSQISEHLKIFGAVCIEGPKWCGKTRTAQHHSVSSIMLGDPSGGFQNKQLADLSPSIALEGSTPRLVDEWQEVPAIWDAVRHIVDTRAGKGQFILTGSSTPQQKGILHSGAGRISTIRMRPMSLFESGDSTGQISLSALFEHKFSPVMVETPDLRTLIKLTIRGGWPEAIHYDEKQAQILNKSYLKAIMDHDIYRLEGINRDSKKINLLLRALARNESTTVSINKLKKDIEEFEDESLSPQAISEYLTLLERLFLIENQESYHPHLRSSLKVKQAPKRHFIDPAIAAVILNATTEKLVNDLNTYGFLFEAMVERDLKIYGESVGGKVYHYQDYKNNEIDAVIELADGRWGAFEIKLGANQIDSAAQNLLEIQAQIASNGGKVPTVLGVICGLTNAAYRRPDGVYVLPITALGN